jgi:hypothetical protein
VHQAIDLIRCNFPKLNMPDKRRASNADLANESAPSLAKVARHEDIDTSPHAAAGASASASGGAAADATGATARADVVTHVRSQSAAGAGGAVVGGGGAAAAAHADVHERDSAAGTAAIADAALADDVGVDLPPVGLLKRRHVLATINSAVARGVGALFGVGMTMWIHSSTKAIDAGCFRSMHVARVLVRPREHEFTPHTSVPTAAALGAFMAKLRAYEPSLAGLIHGFAFEDVECRVGENAFDRCVHLTEAELPHSVTHINSLAFNNCWVLKKAVLPEALTHIGDLAFSECIVLEAVTLPNSLTHIGQRAFSGCGALVAVSLPNSLTHIGQQAFKDSGLLTEVTLPDSLTYVADDAFPTSVPWHVRSGRDLRAKNPSIRWGKVSSGILPEF